ncbi:hypothetical protein [Massilia endophytica]|uniref:hypothetical protein n=1 Tax=Massilia endophytica TaxID=2899220 RepID=UPI001E3C5528|nr:hypothetical protein [Massilia endophytica]UGQ48928.1 hypothetical protein LSQ66_10825 [Massilia endophytica]
MSSQSESQSQWLALGKQFMGMFKELGETGSKGLKETGAQAPEVQAQVAELLKSMLELHKELKEVQSAAGLRMLQAQLGMLNPALSARPLQELLDLHFNFLANLSSQGRKVLEQVAARSHACIGDLREAQTGDEVSLTAASYLRDLGGALQKEAEETAALLNSANAATTILTQRALDELIAARSAAGSSAS